MNSGAETAWIVERAKAHGFELCGVAAASKFPELAESEAWFAKGYAGEMKYLADPRRGDPERVLPGVRSVIVCAMNYNAAAPRSVDVVDGDGDGGGDCVDDDGAEPRGWISRYAWGSDYHDVLRGRLNAMTADLCARFAERESFQARAYADTGPIQERVFARRAGLGWIGKNTLVLNQSLGSWFFLGPVFTTLELAPTLAAEQSPPPDLCGSCTRCIEACPTDALIEPYVMDARRCISYLTIEHRGSVPEEFREAIGKHVYGCDICQDVCPWNRRAPVTSVSEFQPRTFAPTHADGGEDPGESAAPQLESLFHPSLAALASLSEDEYKSAFRGSAIKRTKYRGVIRNACIALGNAHPARDSANYEEIRALLGRLGASTDPIISESALWALARIQ
jgi:epoxyqueuosine reductase